MTRQYEAWHDLTWQTEKALEAPNIGRLAHEHDRDAYIQYALSFHAFELKIGLAITNICLSLQASP